MLTNPQADAYSTVNPLSKVTFAQRVMMFSSNGKNIKPEVESSASSDEDNRVESTAESSGAAQNSKLSSERYVELSHVTDAWRETAEDYYPETFYRNLLQPGIDIPESLKVYYRNLPPGVIPSSQDNPKPYRSAAEELFFTDPFARSAEYLFFPGTSHKDFFEPAVLERCKEIIRKNIPQVVAECFSLLQRNRLMSLQDSEVVKNLSACEHYALSWACENGHIEAVKALFAQYFELDQSGGLLRQALVAGSHGLLYRVCLTDHTEVVNALFAQYREVELRGELGLLRQALEANNHLPLRVACEKGHTEAVKALLARYLELEPSGALLRQALETYSHEALCLACENGHTEVVKALLEQYLEIDPSGELLKLARNNITSGLDTFINGFSSVLAQKLDEYETSQRIGRDVNLFNAKGAECLKNCLRGIVDDSGALVVDAAKTRRVYVHIKAMLEGESDHDYFESLFSNSKLKEFYQQTEIIADAIAASNKLKPVTEDEKKAELAVMELEKYKLHFRSTTDKECSTLTTDGAKVLSRLKSRM